MRRRQIAFFAALAIVVSLAGAAAADPDGVQEAQRTTPHSPDDGVLDTGPEAHQHGPEEGHLPPSSENMELVGRGTPNPVLAGGISDVSALGRFAYVGAWAPYCTRGAFLTGGQGGVFVFDISDPTNPRQVNFLEAGRGNYVTEGVHALHVETPKFSGDLLVVSNERCRSPGVGGITIWDVAKPPAGRLLSRGQGDFTNGHFQDPNATINRDPQTGQPLAHQSHSAMAWWVPGPNPPRTGKAYAVLVDNEENLDVDIMDITDPRNPVLIAETGLENWPDAQHPLAFGEDPFHHDMDVRNIGGRWYVMLSYWDAGWVLLDVDDPANPTFVRDFDYPDPDPVSGFSPAEGNAHQGQWDLGGDLFIGTDEDFSPYRLEFQITTGDNAGFYGAGEFGWTVPIATLPDQTLNGPTVFGGYGCDEDAHLIPPASVLDPHLQPGDERIVVLQRGPVQDPNANYDACFFSIKVENAQDAGYDAVIIANHHVGSSAGAHHDAFLCGSQGHAFEVTAHGVCTGHRVMHLLFDRPEDYTVPYPTGDPDDLEPDVGDIGHRVEITSQFDGWGYVRLIDADTLEQIDHLTIPATMDESVAIGHGWITVHEVETETDPALRDLAYFSWYSGGMRVARFDENGIEEVGHYIAEGGNDFWGVALARGPNGERLILGSDRDSGLWIFRYTGP